MTSILNNLGFDQFLFLSLFPIVCGIALLKIKIRSKTLILFGTYFMFCFWLCYSMRMNIFFCLFYFLFLFLLIFLLICILVFRMTLPCLSIYVNIMQYFRFILLIIITTFNCLHFYLSTKSLSFTSFVSISISQYLLLFDVQVVQ